MTALADAVNNERETHGWSRARLSMLSWIDLHSVSRICRGEKFTPHRLTLQRLDWVFDWPAGTAEALVPAYAKRREAS